MHRRINTKKKKNALSLHLKRSSLRHKSLRARPLDMDWFDTPRSWIEAARQADRAKNEGAF